LLSTHREKSYGDVIQDVPMVIQFNGQVDADINFEFESDTEAGLSCATIWNDEMYVFGGDKQYRQMSKIETVN